METCITCGEMAEFYIENGIAKEIDQNRVLEILKNSTDAGMVIQCVHSKSSEIICSCHVAACGILQAAKMFPGNACKNISHYEIQMSDTCSGCGKCVTRCPMQSIKLEDGNKAVTDLSCVGCGQCVPVCPEHSRILAKKDKTVLRELPDTIFDAYEEMQEYRKTEGDLAK